MQCPVCLDGCHADGNYWRCPSCQFDFTGPSPDAIREHKIAWSEYLKTQVEDGDDLYERERDARLAGTFETASEYQARKLRERGGFL